MDAWLVALIVLIVLAAVAAVLVLGMGSRRRRLQQRFGDEYRRVAEQQGDYRRRWDKIQIDFVDEPRASVRAADELVGEVTDRITSTFSDARSRLEQRWQEGQEPSTEELRTTLRQYRDFFDRLVTR